jgi:hypothetical protein
MIFFLPGSGEAVWWACDCDHKLADATLQYSVAGSATRFGKRDGHRYQQTGRLEEVSLRRRSDEILAC